MEWSKNPASEKKLRIALIYLGRRGSGGPISLNIASHLSKWAEVLCVISTQNEGLNSWKEAGVSFVAFPTYRNFFQSVWGWIDQRSVRQIAAQIQAWKPDVLLFPMFYTWNPLLQRHLREYPAVVVVHDPVPHPDLTGSVYGFLENFSIRQASYCLVFSHVLVKPLLRRVKPGCKVRVIQHGELSYSSPVPEVLYERQAESKDQVTLLFFGRITKYKGLDWLLRAYQELSAEFKLSLLIAGEGNLRPYRRLIKSLSNVRIINRWIGENEIAGFFRQADLLVLPYTSASQSGVIPIAANFGLPVISTRVGGIVEQIQDEKTGLLVEPKSTEALKAAIRRIVLEPEFRIMLGENLRKEFQEHRTWEKVTKQIYQVCAEAANFVLQGDEPSAHC